MDEMVGGVGTSAGIRPVDVVKELEMPRQKSELEAALAAARDSFDRFEQEIARLAERLEPVLTQQYLAGPEQIRPEADVPGGTMRAREVFTLSERAQRATLKLQTLRESVEA